MSFDIAQWIVKIPVLLFAITVHEYAHGRAALWLGDPTAKRLGRLTLNPIPHIDPFGARRDIIFMSLCGPLANILTAFLAGLLIRHLLLPWEVYLRALLWMILLNTGLGLFNLLPIPPLDGSHVVENALNPSAAQKYRELGRYGPLILLGIVMLDNFAHTGIISRILIGPMFHLAHLFAGDNFLLLLPLLQ